MAKYPTRYRERVTELMREGVSRKAALFLAHRRNREDMKENFSRDELKELAEKHGVAVVGSGINDHITKEDLLDALVRYED